ncbi:RNA polymerase sigma factor [Hoylesella nanceiensis]|jgi:RNA polymerase sigma factor, sigma-70 family|uniref:Sigma-70 family RNA polymerase sigma factor n=1 Tax=Hoylesella nanceiensis TaxID=425941 RepID=A0ABS6YAY9_9BACT|nr:sigma-70 family RNA polymerase sigma factor [Hoylesella nanceiensis]MBF1438409.1 sigma-70 family RNA polymerase sigma factor [Hoylesella nanceiensis]MBF1440302.1 sigma-70 family RNA polymerase sigma factor [Hoylesella nanceiensis]MBW4767155.1 sigma-70 family RNA polymerase sigma factor [Hoylesella nanceiensis]MBW4768346.1 sigma-70 family RNA polymerase sigma factor [Hoylesella nanceiensis]MBW4833815.1 sigma-70 family RNA polymerase sigma factor [Hoylesella nanceiensis]
MKQLHEMTNEELALSYINGDNKAFDLLLSRNQEQLFSYIFFIVKDRALADDLFQETFIKVITKLNEGKYCTNGRFGAWLITVAHNTIMDFYRSSKNDKYLNNIDTNEFDNAVSISLMDSCIENHYVNQQVLKDVKRMVDMLPALQREVVFMRFFQQLSFKEIAEITNVSINTALGRMRYAILNLRRMAKTNGITLQLD